ncbi:DUF2842 domain-containing protein, partial [Hansschlegelia zhihuaiae]
SDPGPAMPPRVKKLIGGIALVLGVVIYALVVVIVGQVRLAQSGAAVQLAFFAFFGLIWIIPAALLIRWMERVDRR